MDYFLTENIIMPTPYIKKLAKQGKGTVAELEKKWDKAKEKAGEQGKVENFAYITSIFNKMIKEMFDFDVKKIKDEVPTPEFEQLGTEYNAKDTFSNHVDDIEAGKYRFKNDDNFGHWKMGDVVDIPHNVCPKKELMGKKAYEININNTNVYISKDFLEKINEDDGGSMGNSGVDGLAVGHSSANMTSTHDVAGYSTPFTKNKTHKKDKPNLFWGENELNGAEDDEEIDECGGTDFTYAWDAIKNPKKDKKQPEIDGDLKKKLKIHSPELVK